MVEYVKDRLWRVLTSLIAFILFFIIGILVFLFSKFILVKVLDIVIPDNVMILSESGEVDQILTHNLLLRLNGGLLALKDSLYTTYYWFFGVVFAVGLMCGGSWIGCQRNFTFRDFILKIDNEHDAFYVYNQVTRLMLKKNWTLPNNKK